MATPIKIGDRVRDIFDLTGTVLETYAKPNQTQWARIQYDEESKPRNIRTRALRKINARAK